MSQFELSFLDWMQAHLRCAPLDNLMLLVSSLGDAGIIWILLTLLLLTIRRYRHVGLACGSALTLEILACNVILKPLVGRVRPFALSSMAPALLVTPPTDFSFPSGHVAASFATTAALYAAGSRLWRPAAVLSLLMAFSRMYLYVHFPTDVLAGMVLGIATGFIGHRLATKLVNRLAKKGD